MTAEDYPALCAILQDAEVMYAYEHAFSDEEAADWLSKQLRRYREDGIGLWAVILKEEGRMIGQCGLSWQEADGERLPEIGYLFNKAYWHNGYAIEAAAACKQYAFERLDFECVYSIIRENNLPSRRVAERNGMRVAGKTVRHYMGIDMPHVLYAAYR